MPTTPEPKATNEELLRQVIEAQVRGGYEEYKPILAFALFFSEAQQKIVCHQDFEDVGITPMHVLEILLDTKGCKAAYGDNLPCSICSLYMNSPEHKDSGHACISGTWRDVANNILFAWNSGEGNNVRAALETAVSFLPQL